MVGLSVLVQATPPEYIDRLFEDIIKPKLVEYPIVDRDVFREERLYTNAVNRVSVLLCDTFLARV